MAILETQNLTYKYSVGTPFEKVAIEDISISVEKGDFIGIIGHTGSGKSTLVQHLNGLLKPTSGTILLDGKDIHSDKNFTRQARFKVGLCFQYPEYQLFENTVYEDIAFGPKNMKLSKEEIKERVLRAAEFVGVRNDMLQKSPFDLSGGEKQKLALARALYKDAPVVVLDEPTAALDALAESKLYRDFDKLIGGKTAVYISHRLSSTQFCNHVAMFADGRMVEYGTHEELLGKNGAYAEMFRIQAQYYVDEVEAEGEVNVCGEN